MKLHAYWRSSASYRIRIALNLKGLDYEIIPVNLFEGEHRGADFAKINAFKSLPVLEYAGRQHVQSVAILDLLEQRFPEPSLFPKHPDERNRALEMAMPIATDLQPVNNLRIMNYLKDQFDVASKDVITWYQHWIHETYAPLETMLGQIDLKRGWAFGAPGIFEIMLVPQTYNALRFKTNMSQYPTLLNYYEHCLEDEAFQKASPEAQPDATRS